MQGEGGRRRQTRRPRAARFSAGSGGRWWRSVEPPLFAGRRPRAKASSGRNSGHMRRVERVKRGLQLARRFSPRGVAVRRPEGSSLLDRPGGRTRPGARPLTFGLSGRRPAHPRPGGKDERRVTFDDVAGNDEIVAELREVVEFLTTPEKFQKIGGRIPGACCSSPPPAWARCSRPGPSRGRRASGCGSCGGANDDG